MSRQKILRTASIAVTCVWLLLGVPAADSRMVRIGLLATGAPATMKTRFDALRHRLRELGWVEGQSVALEYRYTHGNLATAAVAAQELINSNVDVIVGSSNIAVEAAMQITKTIPIVMLGVQGDPVETKLVTSLANPGGNVTGVTAMFQDLNGKRIEVFKESFAHISLIATYWNPDVPGTVIGFNQLQRAAQSLRVQIVSFEIRSSGDIDAAFARIAKSRLHGLFALPDPVVNTRRANIIGLAASHKLPGMYPDTRWVEDGGLMSYSPDSLDLSRHAATYVDKILKGARPENLPIEQPRKFDLAINLKTAKQIGLTIPPHVLARADRVIR